jgi:hypothetical protein
MFLRLCCRAPWTKMHSSPLPPAAAACGGAAGGVLGFGASLATRELLAARFRTVEPCIIARNSSHGKKRRTEKRLDQ